MSLLLLALLPWASAQSVVYEFSGTTAGTTNASHFSGSVSDDISITVLLNPDFGFDGPRPVNGTKDSLSVRIGGREFVGPGDASFDFRRSNGSSVMITEFEDGGVTIGLTLDMGPAPAGNYLARLDQWPVDISSGSLFVSGGAQSGSLSFEIGSVTLVSDGTNLEILTALGETHAETVETQAQVEDAQDALYELAADHASGAAAQEAAHAALLAGQEVAQTIGEDILAESVIGAAEHQEILEALSLVLDRLETIELRLDESQDCPGHSGNSGHGNGNHGNHSGSSHHSNHGNGNSGNGHGGRR